MNTYLFAFVTASVVSLFLTRVVRDLAIRINWVDRPDDRRKLHAVPIPAVGGVAIIMSMAAALVLALLCSPWVITQARADASRLSAFCALGVAMLLVGLWDDLEGLTPSRKFSLQIAIATVAWLGGINIAGWHAAGIDFGILSLPITVIWIVGVTNAFNLIDGVDGLAAGAALFATMALLAVSIVTGNISVALILAALAGASAGFLRYNFNPASIFLGDSGSLFLGFMLSVLSIESSQKSTVAFAIAVPIVSLGLPVLDTLVVILRRLIRRDPLFRGDRRHIHHVLLDRGMSPREVVMVLYAVCGALGLLSLLVASPWGRAIGPLLAMIGVSVGIGIQQLEIPEIRALNAHVLREMRRQRSLLASSAMVHTLVDKLAVAADADELLTALGTSLHEAGFVGARLAFPRAWRAYPIDADDWRVAPTDRDIGLAQTLEWSNPAIIRGGAVVTVTMPIGSNIGRLALTVNPDDVHHAAVISWLTSDVANAVGRDLARVCIRPARMPPAAFIRHVQSRELTPSR